MRREFTTEDDKDLIAYIAVENPQQKNRSGNRLYTRLVENADGKWDWAYRHPPSAWRERYKKNQDAFDRRIKRYQEKHMIPRAPSPLSSPVLSPTKRVRCLFTKDEDKLLIRFLAQMAPLKERDKARAKLGRRGRFIYRDILVNDPKTFPWASTHTWQSWRERYVKRQETFDEHINRWQTKHGIDTHAQAKELDKRYAKTKGIKSKVEKREEEELDETGSELYVELGGKRRRSTHNGEDASRDDSARPRKRLKRRDTGYAESDNESESSSEGPVERETRIRPRSRSLEEVKEEEEQVDKLVEDIGQDNEVLQGGDKSQNGSPFDDLRPKDDVSIPPGKSSKRTSSPLSASNIAWHLPKDPVTSTADVGSLYPPVPIAPPPPQSPDHIPGGYPGSPKARQIAPRTLPEPSSMARSHPPTPPPTNVQSDSSLQSLSLESDTPQPSAKARGKERAPPPISSEGAFCPEQGVESSPSAISGDSRRKVIRKQRADIDSNPHRQLFPPSSPSSISDGPFATSPPSPRHTEVIRGMPKPRPGRSFRDHDRVRARNVVLGDDAGFSIERQESNDKDEAVRMSWLPVRGEGKARASGNHVPLQPEKTTPSSDAPAAQTTTMTTARPSRRRVQPGVQDFPAPTHLTPRAPNNTPLPAVPSSARSVEDTAHATESPVATVVDVFASQKPVPSSSKQNPYILRAPHLPEPSTGSTFSHVRSPLPVRHHHDRRRTFGGYGLRPALPDINLLKQLNGKLSMSRSPASTWTRGSPDIQIPPSNGSMPSSSSALSRASDRTGARHDLRRKSVIPLLADSVGDSSVSLSLDQLSPSTSGLIVQVGLSTIFKRMEENHGFSADVIRRTWLQQNMDLNATDKKLLRMRIAAENASRSDGEDVPNAQHASRMDATQTKILMEGTRTISSPHHSPIVYTPPARSRAAHYRRLSEQGRIWEARQREIELASRASESTSDSTPKVDPPKPGQVPVWNDRDDEALRAADEGMLATLSKTFGEEFVRRRFLILME